MRTLRKPPAKVNGIIERAIIRISVLAVRTGRSLAKRFPQRYVAPIAAVLTFLVVSIVLFGAVTLAIVPVLIWDLIDPFGIDVHWAVYLVYLFLYLGAGCLTYLAVRDALDLIEILYDPVRHLVDEAVSTMMKPFVSSFRKAAGSIAAAAAAIDAIIIVIMIVSDPTIVAAIAISIITLGSLVVIGAGYLLLETLRAVVEEVTSSLTREVDRRTRFRKRIRDLASRVEEELSGGDRKR